MTARELCDYPLIFFTLGRKCCRMFMQTRTCVMARRAMWSLMSWTCLWCLYGVDYRSCTMQMDCSEQCVRQYLARYAARCTGGSTPTCEDYSRVHNGGPEGCKHSDTLPYWQRVKKCCGSDCSSSRGDLDWPSSSSKVAESVFMKMVLPVKLTKMFAVSKKEEVADSNRQWLYGSDA